MIITELKVPFGAFSPCFIYNSNFSYMSSAGESSARENLG